MRFCSIFSALILAAGTLSAQTAQPNGKGNYSLWNPKAAAPLANSGANGITYHNGPVMLGTTHIYYIWYGDWSTDTTANNILTNFANHIGGSPYFAINTTYTDGTGASVSNAVTYAGSTTNTSSVTSLSDANIWSIVTTAFAGGMAVDPNGVYFVLTAPGVTETSGFLTQYCGWHNANTYNGTAVKYAFVGNAQGANLAACASQTVNSPNSDPAADGMASVIAHELEETVTDPQLNAWYDALGNESADKCAWNFGTTYTTANTSHANMKLGTLDYLIQQQWLNAGGGSCALSYTSTNGDFGLSVSPASQSVLHGSSTANYVVSVTKVGAFNSAVSFQVSGLPAGVSLKTTPAASSSAATFSLNVAASVVAGAYPLTITGNSGTLTHNASATLIVTTNDYSLSVSPATQNVVQGGATSNYTINVNKIGSFNSVVNFTVTGLPTGAVFKLVPAPSATTSAFYASIPLTVNPGTYPLTITGTSGSLTHTASATLIVTAANLFSVTATSGAMSTAQGSSSKTLVTVTSTRGFSSPITLSVSGLPAGVTASFTPVTITGNGTSNLTFSIPSSTAKGTTNVTVTGTSGTLHASATMALTVR